MRTVVLPYLIKTGEVSTEKKDIGSLAKEAKNEQVVELIE